MCGIAGIVSQRIEHLRPQLGAMRMALGHRGPDGFGEHIQTDCGFVHTRLSIVDLEGGKQPMISNDGRYTITFNGEIYGYQHLRDELDYDFQTHSDTEVILALYAKYGPEMLDRLPGMFAFAIWDNVEKSLFCARDRFGEKPFYYAVTPAGDLLFASELKSILASGMITGEIDPDSLTHYLKKLYVHPAKTIYRNIATLGPGHCLQYRDGELVAKRYWDYPRSKGSIGVADAKEKLLALMGNAIKDQLIADVPVGAFLSGGLDSSTVVAVAAGNTDRLTTLSYRIKGELDEGDYARAVADRYRTRHIELHEEHHSLPELLKTMATVYDEPFADSSNIPTYLICRQARRHCKVVLTGDGADELFGGYVTKYRSLIHMLDARNRPHLLNAADYFLARVINKVMPSQHSAARVTGLRAASATRSIASALDIAYAFFEDDELRAHGHTGLPLPAQRQFEDNLNDAFKLDLGDYMAGDILVKTDRASMANGIELRAPFLDKDLAEFVIALPSELKIDLKRDKKLLRDTFESQWPRKVQARGKQGFGAPVVKWLGLPAVAEMTRDYLARDRKIHSLLSSELIDRYKDERSYRTWTLLTLSLWLEHKTGAAPLPS